MDLLDTLRAKSFWYFDRINGGKIKSHYEEVKLVDKNPESASSVDIRQRNLSNILRHATTTTDFYSGFRGRDLKTFPVINKSIINNNYELFLSKAIDSKQLSRVTTSGSTGSPLTIFQDEIKRKRHTAENIYYNEKAGYKLGTPLYYFRVWNAINKKNGIQKWLQNLTAIDISTMSKNNLFNLFEKMSTDRRLKSILAFASSLEVLEATFRHEPERLRSLGLNTIISMSEALPDSTREFLRSTCLCPVVSRYSNMENGFLAQQNVEGDDYIVNSASFHIELLCPDSDAPVNPGQLGRIVVSDLFNYGMPIIRYDTGDMAILEDSVTEVTPPVLRSIEGRRVDFIRNTKGEILSPHVITNSMWEFSEVLNQFQFIQQTTTDYKLLLNIKSDKRNPDEHRIQNVIKQYIGDDAALEIEYVKEIPALSSGKRKKIINMVKTDV